MQVTDRLKIRSAWKTFWFYNRGIKYQTNSRWCLAFPVLLLIIAAHQIFLRLINYKIKLFCHVIASIISIILPCYFPLTGDKRKGDRTRCEMQCQLSQWIVSARKQMINRAKTFLPTFFYTISKKRIVLIKLCLNGQNPCNKAFSWLNVLYSFKINQ